MKKPIIKILQQAGMEVVENIVSYIPDKNGVQKILIKSQLMNGSPFSPIYQYPNGMISNRNLIGLIDIDFTPPSPTDLSPDSDLPQDQ